MNYERNRHKFRSGDLVAFSHEDWGSWYDFQVMCIRLFRLSEYVHVGVVWRVGGRLLVLEATRPRIRIYPLSKLGNFYWLPMEASWTPEAEEKALSYVGEPYSRWEAIKSSFRPYREGAISQCSELVMTIFRSLGITLDCKATPDEIVQSVQELGKPLYYITNPPKEIK